MNKDEKILELSQLTPYKSITALMIDWLIIAFMIYIAENSDSIVTYLLGILIIATRQQAIGILSHDVVHYRFVPNKKIGDFLGNVLMSWPLFFSLEGYRSMHLRHHSKLNTNEDPDWERRKGKEDWRYPMTSSKIVKMLFFDITGLNLYQNFQKLFLFKSDKKLKNDMRKLSMRYYLSMTLFYVLILGSIFYLGYFKEFILYWMVPYFTFFKFIKRIRAVAEHFAITSTDVKELSRSVIANPVERFIFAQHNSNYHLEHHQYAGVPFYNLPKLHELLIQTGELANLGHISHGYISGVLKEMTVACQLNKKNPLKT